MSQAVNNFTLVGNIVKDPEIKKTESGKSYSFITVAVNRITKNECDFISILVWDKLAENAVKYLHKGDCAAFMGSIKAIKRNDRTELQLTADSMTFLRGSSKKKEETEEAAKPNPKEDKFVNINADPFAPF